MKNFSKLIAVVSVFAVILSVFCACEISFGEEKTTSQTTTTTEEKITESLTQPSSTSTTTQTTVKKIETDSLDTILNNINDYPLGTAGSVTKGYHIVYKLLNYTQNSDFTTAEAKQDYENFKANLSDTQKTLYEENLYEIDYIARQVIENPEILNQYIENAEPISEDGKISLSDYEKLYEIISE